MGNNRAIVIGGGVAGLAAAIRLRCAGAEVILVEKNAYLGGKLAEVEKDGFRFDAGPSLFTMPQYVEELFALAQRDISQYFTYEKSDVACHYFFEDGTRLQFYTDEKRLREEVETQLGVSANQLIGRLKKSRYLYHRTHRTFLEMSLHRWRNFFSWKVVNTMLAIPRLELFTTMHRANKKRLKEPHLVQIFDRYATYNGSNPYQAPGILNVIPHLEHGFGTYFPKKGMRSIVEALEQLAREIGIEIYLNEAVEEIELTGQRKRVKGIRTENQSFVADTVFCNMDVRAAYPTIMKGLKLPNKVARQEPSSSAIIFYWGIQRTFDKLHLHNIFFSQSYREEFEAIFKGRTMAEDPTVYVHISSKFNAEDAPEGKENWFVMVNAPADVGQDWSLLYNKTRERVISKLSRMLKVDIEGLIETEDHLIPPEIAVKTSSLGGALYGSSSNKRSAAFFRHPNFSKVGGLYFVGGSVHPGGGIPLCLLSAKIAVADWSTTQD